MSERLSLIVMFSGALIAAVVTSVLDESLPAAVWPIAILTILIVWAYTMVHFVWRRQAKREIRALAEVLRAYVKHYGELPTIDWQRDEQPPQELLAVLSGSLAFPATILSPRSSENGVLNPDGINFCASLRRPKNREFGLDPWRRPYHFALSLAENSETDIEAEDSDTRGVVNAMRTVSERRIQVKVNSPFAIWSTGPDGINDCGYGDDISSWR